MLLNQESGWRCKLPELLTAGPQQKMIPFVGLLRFTVCETDNHIPENG